MTRFTGLLLVVLCTTAHGAPPKISWSAVDDLVDNGQLEAASEIAGKLREKARASGSEADWAKALVKEVQLRQALAGYETSVRFLRDQAWPKGFLPRLALQLYYAQSLTQYLDQYSYEIEGREKVESKGPIDLKAWTKDQIFEESLRAWQEIWKSRAELSTLPLKALDGYLLPNDYPAHVRGTLRDALTHLAVAQLANSSRWRAEQTNDLYKLDFKALLAGQDAPAAVTLDDAERHPLVRMMAAYDDLESFHRKQGHLEAAFDVRIERDQALAVHFTEPDQRALIRKDLEARLETVAGLPWWSEGKAVLAEWLRTQTKELAAAHAIASEGMKAFPASHGGQRCATIVAQLEQPDFRIGAMAVDGLGNRSVEITHRNVARLWLRAYRIDPLAIEAGKARRNGVHTFDVEAILASMKPAAAWTVELPDTRDFTDHRTFVTPPLQQLGSYVVVASANASFSKGDNRVLGAQLTISELLIVTRTEGDEIEVRILTGNDGRPVVGAEVSLRSWGLSAAIEKRVTDDQGVTRFRRPERSDHGQYFFTAQKGSDLTIDPHAPQFSSKRPELEEKATFVYTDRGIYRPGQKIFWKAIAYRGFRQRADFRVAPSTALTVSLLDANSREVEKKQVTTNTFGSASGEFTIPQGLALGGWQVRSSWQGQAWIQVEEYKRPTFEVSFKQSLTALRLNRPATFTGEARYYFGLPVTNGAAKWRVTRQALYPHWWWEWHPRSNSQEQAVATGTAPLKADGTFELTFTPAADERPAAELKGVSYQYEVVADLTDEGGETRSATDTFRLGYVSVEASFSASTSFFSAGVPGELVARRTNLDGVGRAGKGAYRLLALRQPAQTAMPVDLPFASKDPDAPAPVTEGDRLRPRWDHTSAADSIDRWPDGEEKAHGELAHDESGIARVQWSALPAGAYRVRYETTDDFGAKYETEKTFIVAGKKTPLALPLLLLAESSSAKVGGKVRLLAASGLDAQLLFLEIFRDGKLVERRKLDAASDSLIELPVTEKDRGGFAVTLHAVRDYQLLTREASFYVPWDDKQLKVDFATFRDLLKPGGKETFRVTVKASQPGKSEAEAAELLAFMYDRSLDVFATPPSPSPMSLWPSRASSSPTRANLGPGVIAALREAQFKAIRHTAPLTPDSLAELDSYQFGGMGERDGALGTMHSYGRGSGIGYGSGRGAIGSVSVGGMGLVGSGEGGGGVATGRITVSGAAVAGALKEAAKTDATVEEKREPPAPPRSNFSETAFWQPHLLTDKDGSASIEFTVPDSVTSWSFWVHAITKDLRGGAVVRETRSVKDLMVRPYLPRFFREGDSAELKVVVNNASDKELAGKLRFEIFDPGTNLSLLSAFGVKDAEKSFSVAKHGGTHLTFPVVAPKRVGQVAFRVTASAGDTSDGELRPLPILPSRLHLVQSRFVALRDRDSRTMTFADMAKSDDPTRLNEQLVVTVDAQLFYTVLKALPYLVEYPYECAEQTLNRFVSTGIVSSVYKDFPAVAKMAESFAKRDTPLDGWDANDPNRKMALEETPWLQEAKGGEAADQKFIKVLDPKIARAQRASALDKLAKLQLPSGAFPWFPGGPASPYMTLYLLHGFAKATEFGVEVPKELVRQAFHYLGEHLRAEHLARMRSRKDLDIEFITFLNYVASAFPDQSFVGDGVSAAERQQMLDDSFAHWRKHSPYLKGMLALTLKRSGRLADGKLVFASVMDSAKTAPDQGTFWAQEDRSWLWYQDTIESHAFALRTLMELDPTNPKKDGLVLWLLLNKKLNQWKSTRATAEVIYSLVHYLKKENALGVREAATVSLGALQKTFTFEPEQFAGKQQLLLDADQIDAQAHSTIGVAKETRGFMFASATWRYSTDKLPLEDRGDFFKVSRRYFKRENNGREFVLKPLAEGAALNTGDELEVQLSLRTRHDAEYVHLRDPRAAGLEPESAVSQYRWDLGIGWYEEIRDSGSNFFFEKLPVGEYTFKYRLRASMAGTFRVGPASVQSMYAPEFNAFSAGNVVTIAGGGK